MNVSSNPSGDELLVQAFTRMLALVLLLNQKLEAQVKPT